MPQLEQRILGPFEQNPSKQMNNKNPKRVLSTYAYTLWPMKKRTPPFVGICDFSQRYFKALENRIETNMVIVSAL